MYIWMNDQKQHGVYERHYCRFIAAHPTLGLKLPQNTMWTQLSMTLRCVQHNTNFERLLWGVSKYFSVYCLLSFVTAHPKPSKHSETGKPNSSKHIKNYNVWMFVSWREPQELCHKTSNRTDMSSPVSKQNRSWVFPPLIPSHSI